MKQVTLNSYCFTVLIWLCLNEHHYILVRLSNYNVGVVSVVAHQLADSVPPNVMISKLGSLIGFDSNIFLPITLRKSLRYATCHVHSWTKYDNTYTVFFFNW